MPPGMARTADMTPPVVCTMPSWVLERPTISTAYMDMKSQTILIPKLPSMATATMTQIVLGRSKVVANFDLRLFFT